MDFGRNTTAISKFSGKGVGTGTETRGGGKAQAIPKVHALDPKLAGLAKNYFGLDLENLHTATDADLAYYADRAIAMEKLTESLPILEKHFKTLIDGQVAYEQFVTNVQREVEKGAKAIDKNILDVWLLSKGYENHIKVMGEKARVGLLKIEGETQNAIHITNLDFDMAMRLVALRHSDRIKEINSRWPIAQERQLIQTQQRKERQDRKNLLTYGTKSQQDKGLLGNLWGWMSGKG